MRRVQLEMTTKTMSKINVMRGALPTIPNASTETSPNFAHASEKAATEPNVCLNGTNKWTTIDDSQRLPFLKMARSFYSVSPTTLSSAIRINLRNTHNGNVIPYQDVGRSIVDASSLRGCCCSLRLHPLGQAGMADVGRV